MIKIESKQIIIDEKEYNIIINRKKIKNTYIRIDENLNIVVNTNIYSSYKMIEDLILKNKDKIICNIEKRENNIVPENKIPYLGKIYDLDYINSSSFKYKIEDDRILIYTKELSNRKEVVESFYKAQAEEILYERLKYCFNHFIKFYNIKFPELNIRKMKSRYGTCYYQKNKILLNSYLLKYDIICIDYVIYHELAHFIYHNHGKNFYNLLNVVIPNHKNIRQLLKKY